MTRWRQTYIPTEAEIREACAEIQAGWSEEERQKRAGQRGRSGSRRVRSSVAEPASEPYSEAGY